MYSSTMAAMPNVDRLKLMKPTNRRKINRPESVYINPKFTAMKLEVIYEEGHDDQGEQVAIVCDEIMRTISLSKTYTQTDFKAAHEETKKENVDCEKGRADVCLQNKG